MDGDRGRRRIAACLALLCLSPLGANGQIGVPTAPVAAPAASGPEGPLFAAPSTPNALSVEACPTPWEATQPLPDAGPWHSGPAPRHWLRRQLDLRYSSTHGRAMGPGDPLRGTSWLNRPLSLSLDGGALLMTARPAANVRANNDLLGAIGVGWDWDHYWGSQARVAWSTPELLNTRQTTVESDDNLLLSDLSLLYYPWGDSRMRPYWRVGVGLTDLEYTNDLGRRQHDMLMTIPFGVGLKHQIRRHLAWRLELMNNLAIGQNETSTMNNLSITTGFEWRFGGRPEHGWGWAPRGGAW